MSTSDSVALLVNGRRLEKFLGYRIEADLYCADHYFQFEMADPFAEIDPGMRCELKVNGALAMTGIIDAVTDADDKRGTRMMVEGRDLMGLLVDSYATAYPDIKDVTIKDLAETVLAPVPFINRKDVRYQAGLAGASAGNTSSAVAGALAYFGVSRKHTHVGPGKSIFQVLKEAATSRGATFFGLPDGTFVFGHPKAAGKPPFNIVHRKDGKGNNAFRSRRRRDISRRYSDITIVGQQQGDDSLDPEQINVEAMLADDGVPFYKPFVAVLNDDDYSPAQYARMLRDMQRAKSFQLLYWVNGHSQNGRTWSINELCHVRDKVRGIDGTYLINARDFILSKDEGRYTQLRLGMPGVGG